MADLEELYISHNGITRLEGLEKNLKLRVLDIGNNFIERIENVKHLTNIEELWVCDSAIRTHLILPLT